MESVLLHACCAPCSIAIIDELRNGRALTVYFFNPNIFPAAEYEKRKAEVVRVCREWGIPMIDADREPEIWEAEVSGIFQDREGGPRCAACYRLRIGRTAAAAKAGGFDLFATSLSSGRQKNSEVINAIGRAMAAANGVAFLDVDWKKGGRTERAVKLVAERDIYRQQYCGCRHSLRT